MENLFTAYLISGEAVRDPIDQQEYSLVKRCQSGDPQAMEQIVTLYQNQVYNIAHGLLGNEEDAKDITQDTFLRVWEKVNQFQFRSRFSTWLYRIVVNLCSDEMQKQKPEALPTEIDGSQDWTSIDSETPERLVLLAEQQEILWSALAKLKKKHRKILILREMEDLSYEDISKILGCSLGRVKSQLHEARMQLREILKHQEQ